MTNSLNSLSERIAQLRKERGLTQEQLGQLAGVSAQAVSKWEKGGAPDVELLPTLADRLGVTIDGLFGRDDSPGKHFPQQIGRWLETFPVEDRLNQLMRALASNIISLTTLSGAAYSDSLGNLYGESCYVSTLTTSEEEPIWMRAGIYSEAGLLLGVFSEDFPLYLLLPEPPQGYEPNFAPNEEYRQLFSALSQEGSLEILRYLYGQEANYYTTAAVAKQTGLPQQTVERSMAAMEKCQLLHQRTIETENGSVAVYSIHHNYAFAPFLYLARWLMEKNDSWILGWQERKRPLLAPPEPERKV